MYVSYCMSEFTCTIKGIIWFKKANYHCIWCFLAILTLKGHRRSNLRLLFESLYDIILASHNNLGFISSRPSYHQGAWLCLIVSSWGLAGYHHCIIMRSRWVSSLTRFFGYLQPQISIHGSTKLINILDNICFNAPQTF